MSETTSQRSAASGIVVEDVARSFGEVKAIRDVTLEAKPGEVTGLIGPNGSGKTTLLLMLASLLVPDRGTIRIAGHDPVTESREVRSVMGWMPDVLGSWPTLTVRATLELTGRLYHFDRERAARRATELIALVDLGDLADRPTRVLSRGQKQRLSLARALVHDPSVLLLDEPASGLDPAARVALRRLVRTLADEGRTILISSHVLAELDEMADTAVYLDGGVSASADAIPATRVSVRDWRVRSLAPDKLRAALVAVGIEEAAIVEDGPGLLVPLAGEAAASALLAALVRKKVPITSFAPAVGDLEHTFLDLSEGGTLMAAFFSGLWTITTIELRQRVRGVAWYVLLGIFVFLLLIVTGIMVWSLGFAGGEDSGGVVYSAIIYFVLLLSSLVTPALSGNMVNGDRDAGTLATTQVTLVTTPQLVLGKFVAAWISALAFLVAAVPFILWSFAIGGTDPATIVVSLLVLAFELGVVAAVGVGLSGLMRRPLFSIVVTYLFVALLSIGTLIGFGLGGLALQTKVTVQNSYVDYSDPDLQFDNQGNPIDGKCVTDAPYETTIPRTDLVWWMLAANPYVVLADAVPTHFDRSGDYPSDMFGGIKLGVRYAQKAPDLNGFDECRDGFYQASPSPREVIDSTTPSWLVGMLIYLGLAGGALWGAIAVTHAPSRRLAAGSRVA